jgi:hypothetical protein
MDQDRMLGNDVAILQVEDEKLENAFHSEVRKIRHRLLGDLSQDRVNDEACSGWQYFTSLYG